MAHMFTNVVRVYIGGRDIGTAATTTEMTVGIPSQDVTVFGDNAERVHGTGRRADALSVSGLFDDNKSFDEVGSALMGATGSNNVAMLLLGTAVGARMWAGTVMVTGISTPLSIGEMVSTEITITPDGPLDAGIHYGAASTYTSAGGSGIVGTLVSHSGTTVGTAAFYVSMISGSFGGAGTAKVILQHETGGVFVSIATALFTGSATGSSVRLVTTASAGTMQPTSRVIWESNGTAINVAAGLSRHPYSQQSTFGL